MSEGRKDDGGKLKWDLAPWNAIGEIIRVLTFGAYKYDNWNWASGIKYSRLRAALQRHLVAWDTGEKVDPETGINHLAHAGCCLLFLLTYELFPQRYRRFDDRFIFDRPEKWATHADGGWDIPKTPEFIESGKGTE